MVRYEKSFREFLCKLFKVYGLTRVETHSLFYVSAYSNQVKPYTNHIFYVHTIVKTWDMLKNKYTLISI